MLDKLDYWAKDAAFGFNRIILGEVPNGSGAPLGGGGVLTDYWFKPGISGAFTAYMGTAPGQGGTLSSTSDPSKGKILLGALAAYDEANTRLGIGTQAPTAGLHLVPNSAPPHNYARPNGITVRNNWTTQSGSGTNIQNAINEVLEDDSTYVSEAPTNLGAGTLLTVQLWANGLAPFTPGTGAQLVFRISVRRNVTSGVAGAEVFQYTIRSGGTLVKQATISPSASFAVTTVTLSAAEYALINFTQSLTVDFAGVGYGNTNDYFEVAWAEFDFVEGATSDQVRWDNVSGTQLGRLAYNGRLGLGTGSTALTSMLTVTPDSAIVALTVNANFASAPGLSVYDDTTTWNFATIGTAHATLPNGVHVAAASSGGAFFLSNGPIDSGSGMTSLTTQASATRAVIFPDAPGTVILRSGASQRTNSATTGTTTLLTNATSAVDINYLVNISVANGSTAGDRQVSFALGWTDARGARTATLVNGYALASTATSQQPQFSSLLIRTSSATSITYTTTLTGTTGTYNSIITVQRIQ